jgi:hypothetical protein
MCGRANNDRVRETIELQPNLEYQPNPTISAEDLTTPEDAMVMQTSNPKGNYSSQSTFHQRILPTREGRSTLVRDKMRMRHRQSEQPQDSLEMATWQGDNTHGNTLLPEL